MCFLCGRRLGRAAATVPATASHPAGSVGPTCARKAGLLPPARLSLLPRIRRAKARATAQMDLLEAAAT
jgi:hypothetical protein